MSLKRRVCVVVTARPSYSRIRSALHAIVGHPDLELQLVVAASALLDNYGNAVRVIQQDGFDIAARVFMIVEGESPTTMAKSTGIGLMELATVLDNLAPDVVVTIADRYETIATAIAAAYMNIPVVHVQGGEVTGSIDEKVRHAITKLADTHFVATKQAALRVERMGETPDRIHVTGCPSIDVAAEVAKTPELDFDPLAKYGGVGAEVDHSSGYLVALQHPVTNEYADARAQVTQTLRAVHSTGHPVFWFWPNVDAGSDGISKGIRSFRETTRSNIRFFKNMEPADFLRLACNSLGLVGNSSVAIRECSFLGVPAVNIGTRQSGRERGSNVVDVPYDTDAISSAVNSHLTGRRARGDHLYGDGQAGQRMAELLARVDLHTHKTLAY